jgi:hypothetical protein
MTKTLQQQFLPGSTPIPNWIIDEIMSDMSGPLLKIFLYLFRKTVGWNNRTEEKSLTQMMDDCEIANRNSVVHAVKILCDCWGFWTKFRGKKGQRSSVFVVAGIADHDQAMARIILTGVIYDTYCPTPNQLKKRPPTRELYEAALACEIEKHGRQWWVEKAEAHQYPKDTSSGIPEIPLAVSL